MIVALFLIVLGALWLLSNLGIWPWGVWQSLAQLWPLLLIAWGLDLIVGRRQRWLSTLLLVFLVAGALALAFLTHANSWHESHTQSWEQSLVEAGRARIEIDAGLASLQVEADPDGGRTIRGEFQLGAREKLQPSYTLHGDEARLRLFREGGVWSGSLFSPRKHRWDVRLPHGIPLDVQIETGVGEAELDLRQVQLTKLEIDTGVGYTRIRLPSQGGFLAHIHGGVGKLEVQIPAGLATRIHPSIGLGSLRVRGDWEKEGDQYVSPGFATAAQTAELWIDGGLGEVIVETVTESSGLPPVPNVPPLPAEALNP